MVYGCKKKDVGPVYGEVSTFYANGRLTPREGFDLTIRAVTDKVKCMESYYAFILTHNAKNDSLREEIHIYGLSFNKTGKIPLTYRFPDNSCDSIPTASFSMTGSDGDVTIAYYLVSKKSASYINIDSYEINTKEVKGTFDITFVADGTSARTRAIYPDTIRFTGAKFTTRIN